MPLLESRNGLTVDLCDVRASYKFSRSDWVLDEEHILELWSTVGDKSGLKSCTFENVFWKPQQFYGIFLLVFVDGPPNYYDTLSSDLGIEHICIIMFYRLRNHRTK